MTITIAIATATAIAIAITITIAANATISTMSNVSNNVWIGYAVVLCTPLTAKASKVVLLVIILLQT